MNRESFKNETSTAFSLFFDNKVNLLGFVRPFFEFNSPSKERTGSPCKFGKENPFKLYSFSPTFQISFFKKLKGDSIKFER